MDNKDRRDIAIEGNTLTDDWNREPDPPPEYGQADPQTVFEVVGNGVWLWHTTITDATIAFWGEPIDIED